ncbi:MAG: DUF541 domain-containing protein [Candidatus Latescibacteria bacterium]|nr:DUF541 domain-containing protein [Candidatus Latescibacterota bacterium]
MSIILWEDAAMFCRTLIFISGLGLLMAGTLLVEGISPVWAGPSAEPGRHEPVRTITVAGEGRVSVRPDVARANVGVVVTAPKVKDAVGKSRTLMVAVLAALRKVGVAEKDILTTNYSIYHEQPPPKEEGTKGSAGGKGRYNVTNMVQVTIRDIEKMDAVLDAVTEAGVNQVWGITFEVDNPDSAATKAREAAVVQARAKAEALARAGGVRLGPVLSISEDGGGRPMPMMRMAMKEQSDSGPISVGEMTFSAQVQMVYGIE